MGLAIGCMMKQDKAFKAALIDAKAFGVGFALFALMLIFVGFAIWLYFKTNNCLATAVCCKR